MAVVVSGNWRYEPDNDGWVYDGVVKTDTNRIVGRVTATVSQTDIDDIEKMHGVDVRKEIETAANDAFDTIIKATRP